MMAVQHNKCANNIPFSENTSTLKKECKDDDFVDDKVLVSETAVIAINADLEDYVKYNLIKENEVFIALDNMKTELSLSEEQNNTINENVKIEEGINSDDVKIEFNNGLLFCEQCHVYCRDFCTECGMVVHILNKDALNNTGNGAQRELPHNILEIRESFGQFGIFALKVIPKDVKFGPFTGLNTSENNWKLKDGKSKYLNWMQYINPAGSNSEHNLLAFQYEGNLYYQSTRVIQEGEELLVYFGEKYKDSLNGNVEIDFIPIVEQDIKDVFACTFCCLGFSSRIYLIKHKAICLEGKFSVKELVQCPYCKIYLDEKEYSECHMIYCYQRNIRRCIPLVSDNQMVDVKRGARRLQMYKCIQCNYKTKFKDDLESHSNQHYKTQYVRRDTSGYNGSNEVNSKEREKAKHVKEFKCDYESCGYETKRKDCLKRHIKEIHLQELDYKCEMCEYRTKRKALLEIHMKSVHLKEFSYNCGLCGYKTNRKSHLERHMKVSHLKEFDYKCLNCEYKTNTKAYLERHTKSVHLKEFNYKCGICEYQTNTKSLLKMHMTSVHLKEYSYQCGLCAYKTNRKSYLERHVKVSHLKEFDYKCVICKYKTNTKAHFEIHAKSVHLKEFNYKCGKCEYQTNTKSHLKVHMTSVHLKEYSYRCGLCAYKTNIKSNLEKHMKIKHLKEYDYKCDLCEYTTNRKTFLEIHMKSVHITEFSYEYGMCMYKTDAELYLKRHMIANHVKSVQ